MNNRTFLSTVPSLARILAVLCILLSIGAFMKMDIRKFPEQPVPEYTIQMSVPGLSSMEVDQTITLPVEAAVRSLGSSLKITAESRQGISTLTVQTTERLGSDYRERLEKKLNDVTKQLPVREWSIRQDNLADSRIGYFLLRGADVQTLSDVAQFTVYEKLINLPGVARIDLDTQAARQQVDILFRPSMLHAYGLTPADVLNQLPAEVKGDQIGSIGRGVEQTTVQWYSETEGPFGLGKQMIETQQGFVPLKTLADIRDLRGSKGEEVPVYRGEPAVGVTLYAAETGQVPTMRSQILQVVEELNETAAGIYQLDLVEDNMEPLSRSLSQLTWLVLLATALVAISLGYIQKSITVALLSFVGVLMATGSLLGGMWLAGLPLTLPTLAPVCLFALLYIGAGSALFSRLYNQSTLTVSSSLQASWSLTRPVLLTLVMLTACWFGVMLTDFIEAKDRVVLQSAWPILLFGTLAMLLVYSFILPVLAGTWITEREERLVRTAKPRNKAAGYLLNRWESTVKKGYLTYGVTLAVSLFVTVLLHSFVLVDPYVHTAVDEKKLTLEMVQGSTIDDAIRAAQIAEERLRGISEVRDVYTIATRDRLAFTLQMKDKYEWTRSLIELDKELDKQLREIPGTDPFLLVVNDRIKSRMEFTVKGPSIQPGEEISKEILNLILRVTTRDDKGREIVTDARIGEARKGTYLDLRPKTDMLTRYRVTEADIRRQLEGYLGEQALGSVHWNGKNVAVNARFPENWMDHPDQVKQILIRTPEGAVPLEQLVDWSYGDPQPVYNREDGLYVFKISSAVSSPMRLDIMSSTIPLRLQKSMSIPEGYTILNADQLEKLEKELASKNDFSSRVIAIVGLAVSVLLASLLLQRRTRDGMFGIALLPLISGAATLGLLVMDHPLNVMGFYGIAAAVAIMVQQSLIYLDQILADRTSSTDIWKELCASTSRVAAGQAVVFAAILIVCLPLASGWLVEGSFVSSFTSSLLFGVLLAAFTTMVLLPGMQFAAEWKQTVKGEWSLPIVIRSLWNWWENERIRRQDKKEAILRLKKARREALQDSKHTPSNRKKELSQEDFLPVSSSLGKDA
ncbi:efflux RND transporter permease subunit [Brevibacillus invocatus]|uniref:Efflux RND transporter permease subunit n=1 Tax=Brevibacillus invocatus TaxID=173959 RepID=A0A3M8C6K1_9BACL|nr:efflux RND transporter permease subunit [Brevibacillus invocatus]RNB71113.1 efflux RND transporter permease subunit [Brevibacillus invocatus]